MMKGKSNIKIFTLMALVSAPVGAEQVLYNNPLNPSGGSDCSFSNACGQYPGQSELAQSFTLSRAATIQSFSFDVTDGGPKPVANAYGWAIFSSANGLPTGPLGPVIADNQTVLPLASSGVGGTCLPYTMYCGTSYTSVNIAHSGGPPVLFSGYTNQVTINTSSVNLGPGSYFLALYGYGPSTQPEGWDVGLNDTGAIHGSYGAWSAANEGLAMTIYGTSAPEIDPSSAVSALTLLLGGLMVFRGRRTPDGLAA